MGCLYFLILLLQMIFLLPIKDRRGRRRDFPWMTATLVVINVLIHGWVIFFVLPYQPEPVTQPTDFVLYPFMEVPHLILAGQGLGALSILTSGFLHGGLAHLLGNMFTLWFFGRKVEDSTGPLRFALFYLLCLFSAGLFSVVARGTLSPTQAQIPSLGASGAIFGVMTAYLFLYSDEKVLTLVSTHFIPILPLPIPIWLPAWVFIVQTLLGNALLGELIQSGAIYSQVNVFAHLGGAAGGFLFIYFFLHPEVFALRR